jgi:peptidoglycan/xylan/chitin deacetylase (PgdA/CDA1 family)
VCAPVRIGFQAEASDARVLKELLSPWDISFTGSGQADIVIIYDCEEAIVNKAIIVPHERPDFYDLLRNQKLRLERSFHKPIQVPVSQQTALTILPERVYSYEKPAALIGKENSSAELVLNDELSVLRVDVVKEYKRIVDPILDAKSSVLYRLLTSLPIRYDVAPKKIRDFVMRGKRGEKNFNYCDKLPLDALRFIVAKAVERLSGKRLSRRTWKGKNSCYIVTHDVDTKQGLARASSIKKLEERYDIESAWYVPTKHYSLDSEMIKDLANHGEVGVHGAQHSANLISLPSQKLYQLLRESKQLLSKISGSSVKGFRSPLLQHNSTILEQLKKADYSYDTSIPTWEPKHPQTVSPFGIGTVFPLVLNNLVEIPVSTVQDHQLLYVLGLTAKETVAEWFSFMTLIKEIGGCSVVLSHPEYGLFDSGNISVYEDFLGCISSDSDGWITTPAKLAAEVEEQNAS